MGRHEKDEHDAKEAARLVEQINEQQAAADRETTIAQPKDED